MKKAIPIVLIFLLSLTCFFLLNKNTKDSEYQRLEYATKVSELNARVEYYSKQNKDLIGEVHDLKVINEVHRTKRSSTKILWKDRVIEAKKDCDTIIINNLDSIHLASEALCDKVVINLETQVQKLEVVHENDTQIISSKDSIISLNNSLISDQDKEIKQQNRKILVAKIVTGAAVVLAVIALI